jgi:hypothetical protein
MATLMIEGGFPMWFLLLFGLLALAAAARFAQRPEPRFMRLCVAFGMATAWTTLTGTCAALAAVGRHTPDYLRQHPGTTLPEVLLLGFAESMSAAILGSTVLSLMALFIAVGFFRAGSALDR